jgi:GNAT superfamily N-acetyltransferase
MINIRKAILEDEVSVFQLLQQLLSNLEALECGRSIFRRMMSDESLGAMFVAERDGQVLGLITISYPLAIRCGGVYSCIEEFIVNEDSRGQGIGGRLIEAVTEEALFRNCYEVQVNNPSEIGYPVYIEYGFKDVGKHLKMSLK